MILQNFQDILYVGLEKFYGQIFLLWRNCKNKNIIIYVLFLKKILKIL